MSVMEKTLRRLRRSAHEDLLAPERAGMEVETGLPGNEFANGAASEPVARFHSRRFPVDFAALRRARLTPPEEDEPRLMSQYRQVKRPLIANATGRGAPMLPNGRLIVIGSAMPGEGKTFTALNLAISMSLEKDLHVVLVDADVAKAQLTRVLGAAEAPGLLDALRDQNLDPERTVLPTDIANLSLIPAGQHSPQATELLASSRMAQVAAILLRRDRQRILLFDSPPLLLTSESRVLTQMAGQVVVVVRAEATPQPAVLDALELLQGDGAVYLVLNQSTRATTAGYYYGDVGRERISRAR